MALITEEQRREHSPKLTEADALLLWRMLGCPRLDNLCGARSSYTNRDDEPFTCSLDKGHEGRHRAGPLAWDEPEEERAQKRWAEYTLTVSNEQLQRWNALTPEAQQEEREKWEEACAEHRRRFLGGKGR